MLNNGGMHLHFRRFLLIYVIKHAFELCFLGNSHKTNTFALCFSWY